MKRKKSATMGCGGSKEDAVEGAGVAVKQTPESPKKEPALTQAQVQEREAEAARLAEEAAAKERARIRGCYRCYSESAQGVLQLQWSETAVEGALAHRTKRLEGKMGTLRVATPCSSVAARRCALSPALPRTTNEVQPIRSGEPPKRTGESSSSY